MASPRHVPVGTRSWIAICLALLFGIALLGAPVGAQSVSDPDLDSDGDGIANSHDPDDDNDGITDDIDAAPFDPTRPGSPPDPTSIDPDTDSDGDGIANSHDPDDDNDGSVDASDPVVFDPDNTLPTSPGSSGGSAGSDPDGQPQARSSSRQTGTGSVMITGLPKTGAGHSPFAPSLAVLAALSGLLSLILGLLVHAHVPAARIVPVRRS